jgi:hypothetical protein
MINALRGVAGLETAVPSLALAGLQTAELTPDELADALLLEAELLAAPYEPEDLPDALNLYLRGIGHEPLLKAADEAELMCRINDGKAAAATLVTGSILAPPVPASSPLLATPIVVLVVYALPILPEW